MCPLWQIPNQHTDILTQYWKGLEDKRLCQSGCLFTGSDMYCYLKLLSDKLDNTHTRSPPFTLTPTQTPVCLIIWQQGAHCAVLWLCRAAHHPEGKNIFESKAYPCQSRAGYHKPAMWGQRNTDIAREHVSQLRHHSFPSLFLTFAPCQMEKQKKSDIQESWENVYSVTSFKPCRLWSSPIF